MRSPFISFPVDELKEDILHPDSSTYTRAKCAPAPGRFVPNELGVDDLQRYRTPKIDIDRLVGDSHCPAPKLDRYSVLVLEDPVVLKTKFATICEAFGRSGHVLPFVECHGRPFHHWDTWLHFRNRSARWNLLSLCDKQLHNKHLCGIGSPWHDCCYLNCGMPNVWANFRTLRL